MIYETDTDLTYIYGGSAWQQVSGGTAVGNSGLVYITQHSFTAVTTASINNCFTNTYNSYRILFTLNGSTAGSFARFRLRVGGVDAAGSNYYRYGTTVAWNVANATYNGGGEQSFVPVGEWGANLVSQCVMDIHDPQTTNRTNWSSNTNNTGGGAAYSMNGVIDLTTAYDGFSVISNAGTMTGTICVYGYRK